MKHKTLATLGTFRRKIGSFLRRHKLVILIVTGMLLFGLGNAVKMEMAAKGAEIALEPVLEVFIEKLCEDTPA